MKNLIDFMDHVSVPFAALVIASLVIIVGGLLIWRAMANSRAEFEKKDFRQRMELAQKAGGAVVIER